MDLVAGVAKPADLTTGALGVAPHPASALLSAPSAKGHLSPEHDKKFRVPVEHEVARPKTAFHRPRTNDTDAGGWSTAVSRKFGMARHVRPEEVTPKTPDNTCDLEVPWGITFGGNLRKIRWFYQDRKSAIVMAKDSLGFRTYGTFGRDGFES